jgi:hypothetical protein
MESKPLPMTLFVEEVNVILYALSKLPYDQVHLLMTKLQTMANQALEAQKDHVAEQVDVH